MRDMDVFFLVSPWKLEPWKAYASPDFLSLQSINQVETIKASCVPRVQRKLHSPETFLFSHFRHYGGETQVLLKLFRPPCVLSCVGIRRPTFHASRVLRCAIPFRRFFFSPRFTRLTATDRHAHRLHIAPLHTESFAYSASSLPADVVINSGSHPPVSLLSLSLSLSLSQSVCVPLLEKLVTEFQGTNQIRCIGEWFRSGNGSQGRPRDGRLFLYRVLPSFCVCLPLFRRFAGAAVHRGRRAGAAQFDARGRQRGGADGLSPRPALALGSDLIAPPPPHPRPTPSLSQP